MPAKNTVTILAPDGTPGDIPSENVPAALAAGGKIGVHVYAPDGTPGYVAHDQLGDALKAGGSYSPPIQGSQNPHGAVQSLLNASPAGIARGLASNFVQGPQNPEEAAIKGFPDGGIKGALGQFGLGAYRTLVAPSIANAKSAITDAQSPNLSDRLASGSEALAAIPIVGQGIDAGKSAISQYLSGDRSGAAGTVAGNLLTGGLTAATGGEVASRFKPLPTNLTPEQIAARNIAKSILPKDADFNATADTLLREKGNVEQYAAGNGLTTRTPLDASIAARQSTNALGDFYRQQILDPNADQAVSIPSQYTKVGQNIPTKLGNQQGRVATLADIDKRIGDLNDIIRPARNNVKQGATATDLQALQDVVDEHDSLVGILHKKLGQLTGLDPEVIGGVRQSIGARNELADQLGASANASTLSAGRAERTGSTISKPTAASLVVDAYNKYVRGGPEAIANRAFQKTYPKLNVPAGVGNPASIEELKSSNIGQYLRGK